VLMRLPPVAALGQRAYRYIADSRHCSLAAQDARQQTTSRHPFALIHPLGLLLCACQLGVSSFMFLYRFGGVHSTTAVPRFRAAFQLIDSIGERQPVWPFDLYPTFNPPASSSVQVWEARWVTSSGREMRISPSAYDSVFANSSLTWKVTTDEMLRVGDPVRDEARSLNLARSLWHREPQDIRRKITAANIYRSEYRLQPPSDRFPAALVAQSLLYTFSLSRIEQH